jgi:Lrp/AsnC family transcriptional regulator for asnA, asnC and gidA
MPVAYLLINTESFEASLLKTLKSIKGVEEAYAVYGVYDIVVRTRAETMDSLKDTHNRIRRLGKIKQTLTMIAHEG